MYCYRTTYICRRQQTPAESSIRLLLLKIILSLRRSSDSLVILLRNLLQKMYTKLQENPINTLKTFQPITLILLRRIIETWTHASLNHDYPPFAEAIHYTLMPSWCEQPRRIGAAVSLRETASLIVKLRQLSNLEGSRLSVMILNELSIV